MNARRLVSMLALAAVAGLLVSGCSSSATTSTGISASTAKLSVSDVEPLLGSIDGGTSLTITGQGFVDGAQVTLGPVVATDVVVVSDSTITVVTPPGEAGPVDVIVTTTAPDSVTWDGVFTYVGQAPPPTITTVTAIAGGVVVEFTDETTIADAIENYEYSVDGGAIWTAFDPPQAKVPSVTIDGLTAGTTYQVALRALNIAGPGAASNVVGVTAK